MGEGSDAGSTHVCAQLDTLPFDRPPLASSTPTHLDLWVLAELVRARKASRACTDDDHIDLHKRPVCSSRMREAAGLPRLPPLLARLLLNPMAPPYSSPRRGRAGP